MKNQPWWKEAIVYQIYPRSFKDSNGDGVGDLPGILSKLDYLQRLGVNTIWLSPVYKSPNDDNGYDISDYYGIMDEFGAMADFDLLLQRAHERQIRVVMDLVVNHTSDEHPWFIAARSSKDNPKRDFYIWRKGNNGVPPNNWASFFTGPAWEYDAATEEYYLHLFSKKQPDLNWQNPQVKREIFAMMRYWLDKGVDGFRMDVINFLAKPAGLPDAETPKDHPSGQPVLDHRLYMNQPGIHDILHAMNREVLSHYDVMTVGECGGLYPNNSLDYVAEDRQELNLIFQFDIMGWPDAPRERLQKVDAWYRAFRGKAWNTITFNNHDSPRQVSRLGDEKNFHRQSATLIATFLLTVPGTPFLYQGEEIGMTNVRFDSIDDYRDIDMKNRYALEISSGKSPSEVLEYLAERSRDNARTPMQWSADAHAGFSTGQPWIRVNPNFGTINVEANEHDNDSVLNYYRRMIRFRKDNAAFVHGDFSIVDTGSSHLLMYQRHLAPAMFTVVLNWQSEPCAAPGPLDSRATELVFSNDSQSARNEKQLNPWEARIYRWK
ncbi:MAG: alpha-glucosidase [Candidatus Zhuqueibacterota bacterium]